MGDIRAHSLMIFFSSRIPINLNSLWISNHFFIEVHGSQYMVITNNHVIVSMIHVHDCESKNYRKRGVIQ